MTIGYYTLPVFCVLLSAVTLTGLPIRESKIFHLVSGLLFLLCAWMSYSSLQRTDVLPRLMLLASAFLLIPYFHFLIGHYFDSGRRVMTGIDAMTVEKAYDPAEKAERAGDLETAARIYREFLEKDPGDHEARRRLGDILLKRGDLAGAVASFRKVLDQDIDSEPMMVLAFRTVDLLAKEMGDVDAAIELLTNIRGRMKHPRFASYVDERIAALRGGRS